MEVQEVLPKVLVKEDVNFDEWKCRCSGINAMMTTARGCEPLTDKQWETVKELGAKMDAGKATDKQKLEYARLLQKNEDSKTVTLGDSAIAYLLESYAWETERMCSITKEMDVESFDRGRKTEPESIELLSFVDTTLYVKNEERFENEFLSGIPDILEIGGRALVDDSGGSEIYWTKKIRDIKSCRDYPLFLYKIHKGLDPGNREQVAGYGDILECEDLGVAFTLPTMPETIRNGYMYRLAQKMDVATTDNPEFKRAWAELERSMIFKHMPPESRVYKIPVEPFTTSEQSAVYDRVKVCREWLNNFHEMYSKLNK
jgi:hypothetical protein